MPPVVPILELTDTVVTDADVGRDEDSPFLPGGGDDGEAGQIMFVLESLHLLFFKFTDPDVMDLGKWRQIGEFLREIPVLDHDLDT